jgi:NitT/TauT family transport system substrate-binding protein
MITAMKHLGVCLLAFVVVIVSGCGRPEKKPAAGAAVEIKQSAPVLAKVKINEAARTLLYLPLYHAQRRGFFKNAGVEIEIITGGTATASFAALMSGEADFSQADPMYVPIAREKNGKVKVVAQVVGRIAVWGTTNDPAMTIADATGLKGKRIATHQRPMTAYTYTERWLRELGLDPEKDVTLVTGKPGTELAAFSAKQADFMVSVEPATSQAVAQGGRVLFSLPNQLGDQIFSALMTREDFLTSNKKSAAGVVSAYQFALDDMRANPSEAVQTAKEFFPQLEPTVLNLAIKRLLEEEVWPKSVLVSAASWDRAVAVRVAAGDLKSPALLHDCWSDPR